MSTWIFNIIYTFSPFDGQHVEMVKHFEKQRRLEQILRSQEPGSRIIIFCSTKRMCDTLSRNLGRDYGAAAIHGDKNQTERESVLSQFKSGEAPVLVATDVAARGLDVKDVRSANSDLLTCVLPLKDAHKAFSLT